MAAASRIDRRVVLAMLLVAYIFNFLHRQLLSILATSIKADLGLTDTQLGMLGGVAFATLYTVLGIPLAMLADRTYRSWVITGSLAVWSGFTALCGAATAFWSLFAARVGVGVGEAGGVAPSYALISDYFPLNQRARALATYSLGAPVGQAAGLILGAAIAQALNLVRFGPVIATVQHLVAPHMRATASACFLLIANLLGLGADTWLMGGLSDAMSARVGAEALRYAAIVTANLALIAAALAFLSVRPLRREWVE